MCLLCADVLLIGLLLLLLCVCFVLCSNMLRSGNWLVPEVAAEHLELQLEVPASSSGGSSMVSSGPWWG